MKSTIMSLICCAIGICIPPHTAFWDYCFAGIIIMNVITLFPYWRKR